MDGRSTIASQLTKTEVEQQQRGKTEEPQTQAVQTDAELNVDRRGTAQPRIAERGVGLLVGHEVGQQHGGHAERHERRDQRRLPNGRAAVSGKGPNQQRANRRRKNGQQQQCRHEISRDQVPDVVRVSQFESFNARARSTE